MALPPSPSRSTLPEFLRRAWRSWATRSLAIGAVATVLDIAVGLTCLNVFRLSTRPGAMLGVAIGATFTFFANRHFAFKDRSQALASPALKFLAATAVSMVIHGQLVVMMRDRFGIPFVLAKIIADIGVFSVGQLLLLRFLVFPKKKVDSAPPGPKKKDFPESRLERTPSSADA